jgi:hypothetical protein
MIIKDEEVVKKREKWEDELMARATLLHRKITSFPFLKDTRQQKT